MDVVTSPVANEHADNATCSFAHDNPNPFTSSLTTTTSSLVSSSPTCTSSKGSIASRVKTKAKAKAKAKAKVKTRPKYSLSRRALRTSSTLGRVAERALRRQIEMQIANAAGAMSDSSDTGVCGVKSFAGKLAAPLTNFGTSSSVSTSGSGENDSAMGLSGVADNRASCNVDDAPQDNEVNYLNPFEIPRPTGFSEAYMEKLKAEEAAEEARYREMMDEVKRTYDWMTRNLGDDLAKELIIQIKGAEYMKEASERRRERREDEQSRRERLSLLRSGRIAALKAWCVRDMTIRKRRESLLKDLGLDAPDKSGDHRVGEPTTRSHWRIPSRFHPYSTSIRPTSSKTSRHFNPCDTPVDEALQLASKPELDKNIEELFHAYHEQWLKLIDPQCKVELTFCSVPWPVNIALSSPSDLYTQDVWDFVLIGHTGEYEIDDLPDSDVKEIAEYELHRWHPTNVANHILPRVTDMKEREDVRVAADLVLKALVRLAHNS